MQAVAVKEYAAAGMDLGVDFPELMCPKSHPEML
jgi:hypothetical protein